MPSPKTADLVIAVGTRMGDFTTSSKSQFQNLFVRFVTINNNRYHAFKMDAIKAVGDAKATLEVLAEKLRIRKYQSAYTNEIRDAKSAWDREVERLAKYSYDDSFEPTIQNRDPRTIPEYVELTGSKITQTVAIAVVRESSARRILSSPQAAVFQAVCNECGLPTNGAGTMRNMVILVWGMRVAAALGVKMAEPDNEVYAFVGDGSFQMLHSEIMTSVQERLKVNILVFDNCGFGCINNLQMNHGVGSLATEFRYRSGNGEIEGGLIPVDYALIAKGYGLQSYTARTSEELKAALKEARRQRVSTLIDLKVLPKTMTDGYKSWWNVGVAAASSKPEVMDAYERVIAGRRKARQY